MNTNPNGTLAVCKRFFLHSIYKGAFCTYSYHKLLEKKTDGGIVNE